MLEKKIQFCLPRAKKNLGVSQYFGHIIFGKTYFGLDNKFVGVYFVYNRFGKKIFTRKKYYFTANPRTDNQQDWRDKFRQSVAEWQSLTNEEKLKYNKRAKGLRFCGYHLFLREWLLANK